MISPYELYKKFPFEVDFSNHDSVIDSDSASDLRVMAARSTITDTNTYVSQFYMHAGIDMYHYEPALSLARDYLQGEYNDYVFFQGSVSASNTLYYLLVGDISRVSSGFSLDDCVCYCFKFHNTSTSPSYSTQNPTGFIRFPSLTLVDGTGGASASPYIQEQISIPTTFPRLNYDLSTYQININDDVLEYDEGYLYYTSFEGFPHLIEGVQNYAVAAFVMCFAVLAFKLADRVFRRVY